MKKLFIFLLIACLMLTGCSRGGTEPTPEVLPAPETPTNAPAADVPAVDTPAQDAPVEETPVEEVPTKPELLSLEKTSFTYYEDVPGSYDLLVLSDFSFVTMSESHTDSYTLMAQALDQQANMLRSAMEDECDNLIQLAKEAHSQSPSGFTPYVSKLHTLVRRADSIAVSLLSDSYSDYGNIRNYRVLSGTTFDTQTGQQLMLSDVVTDVSLLPAAVEALLDRFSTVEIIPGGVADYFRNTPEDGIPWVLDYNGVTFFFPLEVLVEGELGLQPVTVPFAEYPELFVKKYTWAPDSYTVEMPLNATFFADLDADGLCDPLCFLAGYDEERDHYLDFVITTQTGDFWEESYWFRFYPCFAQTPDGQFLYLFCEDNEAGDKTMFVQSFRLEADAVTRVSELAQIQAYSHTGAFSIPADIDEYMASR